MRRKGLCAFAFCVSLMFLAMICLASRADTSSDYLYLRVVSNSMQPTLEEGDLVTVRKSVTATEIHTAPFPVGNIIVFYKPKTSSTEADLIVVQRAIANTTESNGLIYFTTKGDGHPSESSWSPDYRGENYSRNGMVSEKLLIGKVVSYSKNYQASNAHILGRYFLAEDKFWFTVKKTVQQMRDVGYNISGDSNWLLRVNYTYLNYTFKGTIIKINWPETTTQKVEGKHGLNVTAFRILENGTIGERLLSIVGSNEPAHVGGLWVCHEPAFGIGFNPSSFTIGNSFTVSMEEPQLEYVVNRTELLTDTPWGQNQTYVLKGDFANGTLAFHFTVWCDAKSGLVLKQAVDTVRTLDSTVAHEEMNTIETGVELVVPVRETPSPTNTVAAVAVGAGVSAGISALMTVGGGSAAQSLSEPVSNLPLTERLKNFFKFHSEKTFEITHKGVLGRPLKRSLLDRKRMFNSAASTLISTFAFAYVEVNGLPGVLNILGFLVTLIATLFSISVITVTKGVLGAIIYKLHGINAEQKIWRLGTIALLISSIILQVPFGSCTKSVYRTKEMLKKNKGIIILLKALFLSVLLVPFSLFFMSGQQQVGDIGLFFVTMSVFFSLIPIWPLEGRELWNYNKIIWTIITVPAGLIFFCWALRLFPYIVYLVVGLICLLAFIITLYKSRTMQSETVIEAEVAK